MRWIYLGLLVTLVSSSGCSAFVASRGVELSDLTTKEQVHRTFGTPVASGVGGQPDQPYEEFRTHRKISEKWKGQYLLMPCIVTLGLSEVVYFPSQLFCTARQCIVGQTIRFDYDANGKVITVDGGVLLGSSGFSVPAPPRGTTGATEPAGGQP